MALTGVHLLLSYQCTHECDHCFVWAGPRAGSTMRLETLLLILDQAQEGGPDELVRHFDLTHKDGYVDDCHLCYEARRSLRDQFPHLLGPPQVYGIDPSESE